MNGTRHTGTSVAVYKDLKEQILHLELPPGSAISEIDTAAAFHVSRTPVRDAFKMLEREGLLEVRPHIGTFVSLIDLNMISDILYLRETLEQAVLRDLTAGYDKSQEFRIRLLLQRQCELLEQDLPAEELGRAFIINDNEFHTTLYELAGKRTVMDFLTGVSSQYERFRTFLNLGDRDNLLRLYNDHIKIWSCISSRDYEGLLGCSFPSHLRRLQCKHRDHLQASGLFLSVSLESFRAGNPQADYACRIVSQTRSHSCFNDVIFSCSPSRVPARKSATIAALCSKSPVIPSVPVSPFMACTCSNSSASSCCSNAAHAASICASSGSFRRYFS